MKRRIKAEEKALWDTAMRGVRRLADISTEPPPVPTPASLETAIEEKRPAVGVARHGRPVPPPPAFLDSETEKRLRGGVARIDARLDLHGMMEHDAHQAVLQLVEDSAACGHRILLVVTGKGRLGKGILRRNLPLWLEAPRLRPLVTGFRTAYRHDGGEGAVYITLRRRLPINT